MIKKIILIIIIFLFNENNLKANESVKIILKINNQIITNADVENEYNYITALNNDFKKLTKSKALKIAKETGCTEKIQKPIIKHKIAQTIPKVLERQQERKNLAMVMSKKDVGNRGDGTMPYELRDEIGKYLGGGKRKTRRSKKSKRKTQKTRRK